MEKLPHEIFDRIISLLSPFEMKSLGNALGIVDGSPENRLWRCIFKNETWFNTADSLSAEPVLIGSNLDEIISDRPGDLFHHGVPFLRESLRNDHHYYAKRHEVVLPQKKWTKNGKKMTIPKITLNIRDIVQGQEFLELKERETRKLFPTDSFHTNYSFLRATKIKRLEGQDIIGIGGKISERKELSPICTFNLYGNLKKWQVTIEAPGCDNVRALTESDRYLPHTIIAWKYTQ